MRKFARTFKLIVLSEKMILFFKTKTGSIIAVQSSILPNSKDIDTLKWLLGNATLIKEKNVDGNLVGQRREKITTWSTTAVQNTKNMNK